MNIINEVQGDIQEFRSVTQRLDREIAEKQMNQLIEALHKDHVASWLDAQKQVISMLQSRDLAEGDTYIEQIVVTELADLGFSPTGTTAEMYSKLYTLMKAAANKSRDNYPLNPTEVSRETQDNIEIARKNAVINASVAGIEIAGDVIRIVIPEEESTPKELVELTSIQDIAQHTIDQLNKVCHTELTLKNFDLDAVIVAISDAISDQSAWLTDSEKSIIDIICSNRISKLNENQKQALILAATSVHVSWSSIQGRRTVYEQGDTYDDYHQALRLKGALVDSASPSDQKLFNDPRFSGLRIFKDILATLPAMMISTFKSNNEKAIDAAMEPERAMNKALGLAIFELMKDLVKIADNKN